MLCFPFSERTPWPRATKKRPLSGCAADFFLKQAIDASGLELVELGVEVLVLGRDAGIAEPHTNGSTRWGHEGNEVFPLSGPNSAYPTAADCWGPARCTFRASDKCHWSQSARPSFVSPNGYSFNLWTKLLTRAGHGVDNTLLSTLNHGGENRRKNARVRPLSNCDLLRLVYYPCVGRNSSGAR